MFVDTHCHLFKEYYDNIDEVIINAKKNNISKIIVAGCNMKSNLEVLELIEKYDIVYGCLGFHPTELDDFNYNYLEWLEQKINHKKIVAIGEIGLDYHYNNTDKDKQKLVFRKQIEIANKYKKAIVIHSRDSIQDTYNIIKETKPKGVLHCYSGSTEMAKEFIKLGIYIGIGGIITFKNAYNIIEVVKNINLKNIILETDSPYLTPEPNRKYKNEPSNTIIIAKKICDIKSIEMKDLAEITNDNVLSIFDI